MKKKNVNIFISIIIVLTPNEQLIVTYNNSKLFSTYFSLDNKYLRLK